MVLKEVGPLRSGRLAEGAVRAALWLYVVACVALAGLNYGYAPTANEEARAIVSSAWQIYENWIKTFLIVACGVLVLVRARRGGRADMRMGNLAGFACAALAVHVVVPLATGVWEAYFFAMPLPWTNSPFLLSDPDSWLSRLVSHSFGPSALGTMTAFYIAWSALVFVGTALFGRRWQCSTLCLFNGFAAECFAPAMPLVGKEKFRGDRARKAFRILRWVFFSLALALTSYWVAFVAGVPLPGKAIVERAETLKYLGLELLPAMVFWVIASGRGYCRYCPLGTMLSLLSRAAGGGVDSDASKCVRCGACDRACPVAVPVRSSASIGRRVVSIDCVGCGHCVDACPTRALRYGTAFTRAVGAARKKGARRVR
jgi:ferredoxin